MSRTTIKGGRAPARNKPCPCGSGKKFKKCHMDRQLQVPPSADELAMMDAVSPVIINPETIAQGLAEGKTMGQIIEETDQMFEQQQQQAEHAAGASKVALVKDTAPVGD